MGKTSSTCSEIQVVGIQLLVQCCTRGCKAWTVALSISCFLLNQSSHNPPYFVGLRHKTAAVLAPFRPKPMSNSSGLVVFWIRIWFLIVSLDFFKK